MKKTGTFALVVLLLSVSMLTAGAGAFTATESQRAFEIYSDDNPGTLVDFVVVERDETACSVTFEVTNNFPVPEKNVEIDDFEVRGDGFDAWTSSVPNEPIAVGDSTEVRVLVEDGYVGRGTLHVEMDMSGENVEITLEEETWVRCEEPEEEGGGEEGNDGRESGGGPPSTPPGRK